MDDIKTLSFGSKKQLKRQYNTFAPCFEVMLSELENRLKKEIKLNSKPILKSRVKEFESFYRKILRLGIAQNEKVDFPTVTDLLGIRLICPFLEDLRIAEEQIQNIFVVTEIERKGANLTFSEFGYESIHVLVQIPDDLLLPLTDCGIFSGNLLCEIQIRTILQDAWAEVEHELVYKSEFSPFDLPLRRKLASMNASLSLADIVFQEIRDYQNKLNQEIEARRKSFYEQADFITFKKLDVDSELKKSSPLYDTIGSSSPYVRGTIDDLLLEAIHAHNIGNLDKAIEIYTRILKICPEKNTVVLSVVYKHRGMAFFSQRKYENAKEDFTVSVEYDKNNFKSLYYLGIIHSALNDENTALKYFEQSLVLNHYQAHVHFRKALALYHLNRFSESKTSLTTALQLGLPEDEALTLTKLLDKSL